MAPIQPASSSTTSSSSSSTSPSLFHKVRLSQYLSIPPISLQTALPSLCATIFSPLLLSYYAPARGIVLAYENVVLSEEPPKPSSSSKSSKSSKSSAQNGTTQNGETILLKVVDEYSAPFIWATADFLIWRPEKNIEIEGRITHQSSTHITLSYLNAFPVSVLKQHLPTEWRFYNPVGSFGGGGGFSMTGGSSSSRREGFGFGAGANTGGEAGDGYWVDGDGMPVGEGVGDGNGSGSGSGNTGGVRVLRVWIRDWDARVEGEGEGRKSGGGGVGTLRIEAEVR